MITLIRKLLSRSNIKPKRTRVDLVLLYIRKLGYSAEWDARTLQIQVIIYTNQMIRTVFIPIDLSLQLIKETLEDARNRLDSLEIRNS